MQRRTLVGGLLAGLPAAAAQPGRALRGKFVHHVFFWLNQPRDAAAREQFLAALGKMKAIPGILEAHIGAPAGTPRDVVDNSWTFDWIVTFTDKAAWQIYNDHAIHEEFRQQSALWKKVAVYDSQRVA